ncbi:hypothetical protein FGO68_gene299 [Halteria grandinella]|uniref:Uncharacterized protein n=1 Tax=Halteria grandinella TaxID=5974 RepID=A0A8J8P5B1_HALGN|nr:hypothetical protein FGO68_gene299 [Halteria grandinella]
MIDLTSSISYDFMDGFHLIELEFSTGKYLLEYTNANLNEEFEQSYDPTLVMEGNVYATVPKFAWYVFPFANGSSPYYTLNADQERDVKYCRNNYYFQSQMLERPQTLIAYDTYFLGFDSGVLCMKGSSAFFRTAFKTYSSSYCLCDAMGNCYFSGLCRPWFVSQKQNPDQCFLSDLYLFAQGTFFGLGISAPLHDSNGKFIGAIASNVIPTYNPARGNSLSLGNYVKNLHFQGVGKANYLIADNQPIWNSSWNMTAYVNYLQVVEDSTMNTTIKNFGIHYEFPERSTKIAYFDWNHTKYAMMMQNFSVQIIDYKSPKKIQKDYTLGVMFESSIIEQKIAATQKKFFRTFIVLFIAPFLFMVTLFLICEVIYLTIFTRRIFSTINDLFEKIDMLSKQHSKLNRKKMLGPNKSKATNESLKTQEIDQTMMVNNLDATFLNISMNTRNQIIQNEVETKKVDVLQDYQGKESCIEVTKLYRAANKLIKTLSLAKTSILQGNDNTALLSYNEVAHLFAERHQSQQEDLKSKKAKAKNQWQYQPAGDQSIEVTEENIAKPLTVKELGLSSNLAICYNNIACIHAKKRNFMKQNLYFEEAIRIEELIVRANKLERNFTTAGENFKLAVKHFNYGYSLYRQYIFYIKEKKQHLFGYYYEQDSIQSRADENLKKSHKYFNVQLQQQRQGSTTQRREQLTFSSLAFGGQRSFRDVCIFIRMVRVEMKIYSHQTYSFIDVQNSIQKLHFELFSYLQSDEYEDGSKQDYGQCQKNKHKGLWLFKADTLLQKMLFLVGLYYEQRGRDMIDGRSEISSLLSSHYYLLSFSSNLVSHIELNLMRKSLKKLNNFFDYSSMALQFKCKVIRLLSKFYVTRRAVQVIMELCNDDPTVHETMLNFVKATIFDKLRDNDHFGLMTMRSGKQPFSALKLEQKFKNLKVKQKVLRELNFTFRNSSDNNADKVSSNTGLQQALKSSFHQMMSQCPSEIHQRGSQSFISPQKWVVAIVGPQQQKLKGMQNYLKSNPSASEINLIIIGVSVRDSKLCKQYRRLCHMTPEGQFVNLNFCEQEEEVGQIFAKIGDESTMIIDKGIDNELSSKRALECVEAALSLYESIRHPFITEHIDFN